MCPSSPTSDAFDPYHVIGAAVQKPLLTDGEAMQKNQLIGVGAISGSAKDVSRFDEQFVPVAGTSSDETPVGRKFYNDMFGGISAIAWSGESNLYWMLPDRGPLDGAVDGSCRVQKVRIEIDVNGESPIEIVPVETVMLKNRDGLPFTDLASAYQAPKSRAGRLDPEGIRVGRNGNLFIADEYGPRLIEFAFATDCSFVSGCSPPFLKETQLPYTSGRQRMSRLGLTPNNSIAFTSALAQGVSHGKKRQF